MSSETDADGGGGDGGGPPDAPPRPPPDKFSRHLIVRAPGHAFSTSRAAAAAVARLRCAVTAPFVVAVTGECEP
eukprot:355600-Chlamydomonas_euryale.AAC.2